MIIKTQWVVLLLLSLLFVFANAKSNVYSDIEILSIERNIDTSQNVIVRQEIKLAIQNVGSSETKYFYVAIPKSQADKVSYVAARQQTTTLNVVKHAFEDELNPDALFFEIELSSPLASQKRADLVVNIASTNVVTPFPKEIKQEEHQKVVYEDSVYMFTPYKVKSQVTNVKVGTPAIESYSSDVKPAENRGNSIVYGPYRDIAPFKSANFRVHYTNDRPFFVVESVERTVEISHWGNLAVEEHYEVKHSGAKLIGAFSRYEYSKNPAQTSPSSFRKITATLPLLANEIYFRDRIGNISSSDIRVVGKNLEVDFYPRFPLFGGWKIRFYIGYNLPISDYLTVAMNNPEKLKLRYKFSIPFDAPVENLSLKVVIPEGATDVEFRAPFPVDSDTRENLKTYLDVGGRTVVSIVKKNVVPEHNDNFLVSYNFAASNILFEPMLVIGSLFAFCLFVMVYVRVDLSVAKSEEQLEQDRETLSNELTELYVEKFIERDTWYAEVEKAIANDNNNANKVIDEVEKKRQDLAELIKNEIISELNKTNSKSLAYINKVEKKEQEKFELLKQLSLQKKKGGGKEMEKIEDNYDKATDEIYASIDILRE